MAIGIKLERTETELFCSSKWWGDPDMPADMEYPFTEDYPLTFICQIACEDIAPFDPEGRLPHEGMLYVFAAVDEYAGYESPVHNGIGLWPRKQVVVKYTKAVNFETFRSAIFEDEDGNPVTEPALKMTFCSCADDADCTKLLGRPFFADVLQQLPGHVNFLQIDSGTAGLQFYDEGQLNLLYSEPDFAKAKWHLVKGYLSSL
ncbi:MAG: DUF1963 domain-containing protein [Bacteroidales bacterium]|nr:DUF1963 domain-containing protein [Bacteroidales bacterium]